MEDDARGGQKRVSFVEPIKNFVFVFVFIIQTKIDNWLDGVDESTRVFHAACVLILRYLQTMTTENKIKNNNDITKDGKSREIVCKGSV